MKYKSLLRKSLIAAVALFTGNTCFAQFPVNIGTLPPGKTIIVQNSVIINTPFLNNPSQVTNQHTVSGSNFSNVLSNDPKTAAPNDPTITVVVVCQQPALNATINTVNVVDNNNGTPDLGAFSLCNTGAANNIQFGPFSDNNTVPANPEPVYVIQTMTLTNVTFTEVNGTHTLADYTGLNGTVALVDPTQTGTLVMTFQLFADAGSPGNGTYDAGECIGDVVQYTVTVNPIPVATIVAPLTQTICAGQPGSVSISVIGTPAFTTSFDITKQSGSGTSTLNYTFTTAAGNTSVTIPAANLTNTGNTNTVYLVTWNTFDDATTCTASSSGSKTITVQPLPGISVSSSQVSDICPGNNVVFDVIESNAVGGTTFNWIAKDANNVILGSANGVLYGVAAVNTNLGLSCPITHVNPISFTLTPVGPGPQNCLGIPVTATKNIRDAVAPTLTGVPYTGHTGINECNANVLANIPFDPILAKQGYSDNCGGPVTAVYTSVSGGGSDCAWSYTYTFEVDDACGNILPGQTYTISGFDQTAPTLTGSKYQGTTGTNVCMANAQATVLPFDPTLATQGYTDNCGGPVNAFYTGTQVTGTNCAWTVTYTYDVKDECLINTLANQSYSHTGGDKTAPTLTGIPYAGTTATNSCMVNAATAAPFNAADATTGYTDNCGGPVTATLTNTNTTGTDCLWTVTYTFSVTDACNNTLTSQSYSNTGSDQTPPSLTGATYAGTTGTNACLVNAQASVPAFSPANAILGYTDNCNGPVSANLTNTTVTGDNCNWTVTYFYSVKDGCLNALTNQSYTHTGGDKTAPTLIGAPYPGTTGTNACIANAATAAPFNAALATTGYTDNCGGPVTATLTNTLVTGTSCNWKVTYTFSVTDGCGNTLANQSYFNTGSDQTPPTITCPSNVTVTANNDGSCTATNVNIGNATIADNCSAPTVTSTFNGNPVSANTAFPQGNNTVVWTVSDGCNSTSCNQTVTVNPFIANVNQPVDQTVCNNFNVSVAFTSTPAVVGVIYDWTNSNTAIGLGSPGSGNIGFTSTNATNNPITGTIVVTPRTNCPGSAGAPKTFTITVIPTPVVNQPANVLTCCNGPVNVVFTSPNGGAGTVSFTWTNSNTAIGLAANGSGNISFTGACTPSQQSGTIVVTPHYTLNNVTCNGASKTFTITVQPSVVGTINNSGGQAICNGQSGSVSVIMAGTPIFNAVFNIAVLSGTGVGTPAFAASIGTVGLSNVAIPAANLSNTSPTATIYRVTWVSVTDGNGCNPVPGNLTGFEDITVYPVPSVTAISVPVGDQCPGTAFSFMLSDPTSTVGATFSWVARDAANNIIQSGSNLPFGNFTTNLGFSSANCNNILNPVTFTFTPIGPGPLNCQGIPITKQVTIKDVTAPTLIAGPPPDSHNAGNTCLANAPFPPLPSTIQQYYTDACTALHTVIAAPPVVTGNDCSWTKVYTYKIADACNNTTTFIFTELGGDTQAPTWVTPAGSLNTSIEYCNNAALATAQLMSPTASDNCNGNLVPVRTAGAFVPGTCATSGTITNTWVVNDGCNNTSVVFTQTITITDNTGPVIIGASNQTLNVGGANCSANLPNYILSQPSIVATDCAAPGGLFPAPTAILYNNNNTGNNLMWQSPAPGTLIIGSGGQIVPVTITAMDACGNSSTATINVTLVDVTAPTAICRNLQNNAANQPDSRVVLDVNGNGTIDFTSANSQINNGSNDNCSPITLSFAQNSIVPTRTFTCSDILAGNQAANINVTMWVTDPSGNKSSCVGIVTVVDLNGPVFGTNCPANNTQFVNRDASCVATLPNFITQLSINATDACGPVTYSQSPAPGTGFGAGIPSTSVTITATDAHSNQRTCTFNVTFNDVTAPVITCPANMTVNTGAVNTNCSVVVNYPQPTAMDNCTSPFPGSVPVTLVSGPASGAQFMVGTTTVTYRATDAAGNSATCSFTVTVIDNTPPTIACQSNKTVTANSAGCVYVHNNNTSNWNPAIFDNCLLANTPYSFTFSGATTGGPFSTLDGRTFNLGTTTVTATAMDVSGNISAPCTFTVTVLNNAVPAFTNCPASFTTTTAAPNGLPGCRANVALPQPTTTQNCTTVQDWAITAISGGTPNSSGIGAFPTSYPMNVGQTQVQYRLTDGNGNSTICIFNVTVNNASAGSITGTTTAAQNNFTTSTITFTGSGGSPDYCFTYNVSVNAGPAGATQTICTTSGQSTVTVSQSNAVMGTYVYQILSVTDANGCPGTLIGTTTATITVGAGAPDLTSSQFFNTTQIFAGGTIDEVIVLRNVGTVPTSGPITINMTVYSALTGLTISQLTAGTNVVIGIDTYSISAGWTFNAALGTLTSNNVIAPGGSQTIGLRMTRGTTPNQGANGSVTQTTTIQAGTGGGETPSSNNTISNSILKN